MSSKLKIPTKHLKSSQRSRHDNLAADHGTTEILLICLGYFLCVCVCLSESIPLDARPSPHHYTQQIAHAAITDTVFGMQILEKGTCNNKADAALAAELLQSSLALNEG